MTKTKRTTALSAASKLSEVELQLETAKTTIEKHVTAQDLFSEETTVELQAKRIAALEDDLHQLAQTAWHKIGEQEYRCNSCGGVGSYPRSIDHHADCIVRRALLAE